MTLKTLISEKMKLCKEKGLVTLESSLVSPVRPVEENLCESLVTHVRIVPAMVGCQC